jgi:hypothetical protein
MENNRMETNEIFNILDSQSRVLVGVLLKRIELLDKENALTPNIYRALVKEHCYEAFRTIKTLINGKVEFKTKVQ